LNTKKRKKSKDKKTPIVAALSSKYIAKNPFGDFLIVQAENVATIEVLLSILEQSSSRLQITKSGSLIILPAKKEVPNGKIKGVVVDGNSGESLIGANIMIVGTSIGAAANIDGEFVLASVEPGEYTLKISYVGYKDKIEKVTVVSNRATEITVELSWIAVEGKEVLVTAQAKGQLAAINEQLSSNEIKNRVGKIAELLKLSDMFHKKPHELSGGQKQRTALAWALVKDSGLILLDEPLANLDFKLREELREELPRLFENRDCIVVYATTEPVDALLIGGNTATLYEGGVIQ